MSLADSLYVLLFTSGLMGGFGHCVGMCGPVVAIYSAHLKSRGIAPHLLYSLGRITTYSILGGMVGLTGSFVSVMKYIGNFQTVALTASGLAMIAFGLAAGGWFPFLIKRIEGAERVSRWLGKAAHYMAETRSVGAFYPMGLIFGFIPCGLLYTALIAAAGAGVSAANHGEGLIRGMLLLALFGIGTAPALVLLGQVVAMKGEWIRRRLYKASAAIMVATGILLVYRALG